ncbi:MAG: membrane protein [Pseudohongiellaceae bacterium]|jgi:membrane protein
MLFSLKSFNSTIAHWQTKASDILWRQDTAALALWQRILLRSGQILVAVARDLIQGQLSLRAMSLVFTTVIGFFPLLALTFAILKSLGVHNAMEPTLMALLEPLGDRQAEVTQQILGYVDAMQVELIGITSVGLLLYIVLGMMRKIELSFNYIWAVEQSRSWSSRVSEYLFAVIVSPLLLFVSISITSSVNTNFFQGILQNLSYGGFILQITAFIAPVLLMSLAFAFAYSFLPNTKVNFGSAFIGGLITTIIWKLMGTFFQEVFISQARESIYLAFAGAIVIMIFTYIGWLVALVGSSIAFYHQFPAKTRSGRSKTLLSIFQHEENCLTVAALIIGRFQHSKSPLSLYEIANAIGASPVIIDIALTELETMELITQTNDEPSRYVPTKSVDDCSMVEVWIRLRQVNSFDMQSTNQSAEYLRAHEFQNKLESIVKSELGGEKFFSSSKSTNHEV